MTDQFDEYSKDKPRRDAKITEMQSLLSKVQETVKEAVEKQNKIKVETEKQIVARKEEIKRQNE